MSWRELSYHVLSISIRTSQNERDKIFIGYFKQVAKQEKVLVSPVLYFLPSDCAGWGWDIQRLGKISVLREPQTKGFSLYRDLEEQGEEGGKELGVENTECCVRMEKNIFNTLWYGSQRYLWKTCAWPLPQPRRS